MSFVALCALYIGVPGFFSKGLDPSRLALNPFQFVLVLNTFTKVILKDALWCTICVYALGLIAETENR